MVKTQKRQKRSRGSKRMLSRRRAKSARRHCAFGGPMLTTPAPKVLIDDVGRKSYVGEDLFFNEFVFPFARHTRNKRTAAKQIPGLACCSGRKGITWRLSWTKFSKEAKTDMVRHLEEKIAGKLAVQRRAS